VERTEQTGSTRRAVKAAVVRGDRVLLVTEQRASGGLFWTLPGGGIEQGETLAECLRREMREELRCDCTVGDRLGSCRYTHSNHPATSTYLIHEATLAGVPSPNPLEGVVGCGWYHPRDLPPRTLDPIRDAVGDLLTG
jgi:ADP-ribose pyrophosphatase YjhB (NUDIX family)